MWKMKLNQTATTTTKTITTETKTVLSTTVDDAFIPSWNARCASPVWTDRKDVPSPLRIECKDVPADYRADSLGDSGEFDPTTPNLSGSPRAQSKAYSPVKCLLVFAAVAVVVSILVTAFWHVWRVYTKHYARIYPDYDFNSMQHTGCLNNPETSELPEWKTICTEYAAFVKDSLAHKVWEAVLAEETQRFNWIVEPLTFISNHPVLYVVAAMRILYPHLSALVQTVVSFVVQLFESVTGSNKQRPS